MYKKLLPFLFVLFFTSTKAQNIQSISFQPTYPGPLDSVKIIVDLMFTSGSCDMQYASHTISNDTVRINVFHCPGALTVICYTTDTIELDPLPGGNYYAEVIVHTASTFTPDPCTEFNPVDSADIQFTVLPGSGIDKGPSVANTIHYLNSSNELILTGTFLPGTEIHLYNVLGKLVFNKSFDNSNRIHLPNLSPGGYMFSLKSKDGTSSSGKFYVN